MKQFPYIVSICFLLAFTSCKKLWPAAFWTGYQPDLITLNESDQGPWGGERKIHWNSDGKTFFHIKDVENFATENNWKLTDSLFVNDSV